jgi:hypothetical protein
MDLRLAVLSPRERGRHVEQQAENAKRRHYASIKQQHQERVEQWRERCAQLKVEALMRGDDPRQIVLPEPPILPGMYW